MRGKDKFSEARISRRAALALFGAAGAAWVMGDGFVPRRAAATPGPSCIVRPEQTEGPYFLDERLNRSDIRSDPTTGHISAGTPLTITFKVMRINTAGCQPLPHAFVDIWHCDERGIYSDVQDPDFNTIGQKFLRGCQVTDAQGEARFLTIYPGWYPIRTVHVHFKIRTTPTARQHFEFTSQIYFPDDLTDRVHAALPYAVRGRRRVRNQHDFIFRDGGDRLMLAPTESAGGHSATFSIGLQF